MLVFPLGSRWLHCTDFARCYCSQSFAAAYAVIDVACSVALHEQLLPACTIAVVTHVPCTVTHVMATTAIAASAMHIDVIACDVALAALYLSYCTSLVTAIACCQCKCIDDIICCNMC